MIFIILYRVETIFIEQQLIEKTQLQDQTTIYQNDYFQWKVNLSDKKQAKEEIRARWRQEQGEYKAKSQPPQLWDNQ